MHLFTFKIAYPVPEPSAPEILKPNLNAYSKSVGLGTGTSGSGAAILKIFIFRARDDDPGVIVVTNQREFT